MTTQTAAFFDLDRTLIDLNSGMHWARHERRSGNISGRQFAKATLWGLLYHFNLIDLDKALDEAIQHYRGVSRDELDERTRTWFFEHIESRYRGRAREAVSQHKKDGQPVVILTTASCFEASVAAETWGFDGWLANDFTTDERNRLTGQIRRPACHGAGKVHYAEAWSRDNGVSLANSFFYTDSHSDLPLLEVVGEPRVVCPDPRLRREATRRGWPILDW